MPAPKTVLDLVERLRKPPDFARDVSGIGYWGMGDLELQVTNAQQLIDAEPLIRHSYDEA